MTVEAAAPTRGFLASIGQAERPALGVLAVMLGAFISSLNTKITTSGLADIRGGLGLGFDEGAWVSTVFGAAQMVAAPAAGWMATVFSTRRVLIWTGMVFTVTSLFPPYARDYDLLIALQLVRGFAVGAFIPAALGFVLRSLTPAWWMWGIGAYAFRFVFSQNIAGSIEGFYAEAGTWEWIFWQNAVLTPLMIFLAAIAMPRRPVDRVLLQRTDWAGIVYAGIGFGLVYAALDQGNRLDWFNSGVICGLLAGGALLIVAFLVQETRFSAPLISLPVLFRRTVAVPAVLIMVYSFGFTATGYVLPDYLTRIQGLRQLQIADVLNWIALPQIVLVPLVAVLLRRVQARLLLALGFALIAVGAWLDTGLTSNWARDDFLLSQCIEAAGLALGITALIVYTISNATPQLAAAIAAIIQIARLLGAECGTALMQTFVRVREQLYSNLLGLHVLRGAPLTEGVAAQLATPFSGRQTGLGDAAAQGIGVLALRVQQQAYVLAYVDAFWLVSWVLLAGMLLVLLLPRSPPNPLTPPRLKL